MANRYVGQRLSDSIRNYVAKTVFTYTQTMGLKERHEIEGLTEKVISRLEKEMSMDEQTTAKRLEPTLPGMEHLVAPIIPQLHCCCLRWRKQQWSSASLLSLLLP